MMHWNIFSHCRIIAFIALSRRRPIIDGLRNYGTDGQIGLEPTLHEFIETLVVLFREARRVLRADGTMWINMGDSYASSVNGRKAADVKAIGNDDRTFRDKPFSTVQGKLKPKDLLGQPWRLAFALQDDGWWLRSEIIWSKPNPMPSSAKDRPTVAHETVFLFAKSARYWYDGDAIREGEQIYTRKAGGYKDHHNQMEDDYSPFKGKGGFADTDVTTIGRNKRTVWTIPTQPSKFDHFAAFPEKLIEPMILAGCPPKVCTECGTGWKRVVEPSKDYAKLMGASWNNHKDDLSLGQRSKQKRVIADYITTGWQPSCDCNADTEPGICLDFFMGSGTTALVAQKNNRRWLGCEINPDYIEIANTRLQGREKEYHDRNDGKPTTTPMFDNDSTKG